MDNFRIGLHLLAASVWVGGQIVLAGLVPTLRQLGEDAPRAAARAFGRVAWPAYGLTVVTGIWNLLETPSVPHPLFEIKFLVVLASGVGSVVHSLARGNKAMLAIGGAVASLGAVAALFLGVAFRFA